MANYEVKKVGIASVVKNFPIVFAILGALIGIFTFFIFPTDLAANLGFGARLLSWLIFIVLYTVIMSVGVIVVAWIYNFITGKVGGAVIELDQTAE
ncbi:MAG: hypothetical protein II669_02575 [Elusimicrobia bacterium]|nr:hypothetical protein [Elusimicrobiota bacterium]MBR4631939.1 hypothetical protein [Elusimicrobiota bacterium]